METETMVKLHWFAENQRMRHYYRALATASIVAAVVSLPSAPLPVSLSLILFTF